MISAEIHFFDLAGNRIWETSVPERIEIEAPFGALEASARVVFRGEASPPDPAIGARLEIRLDEVLKFRGEVSEIHTRSAYSPLVLRAMRRPERVFRGTVRGVYEGMTPTAILSDILEGLPGEGPVYSGLPESTATLDLLDFQGVPLFYAVDLLARLAGNWLWWIDWEGELHFVPPTSPPEHVWHFDPERMLLQPAATDRSIKNLFSFHGGVSSGAEFVRFFEEAASRDRFGDVEERLYARSIRTAPTFERLKAAVLEQAPWPTLHRWIDRFDESVGAFFGERFELRGNPLFPLVDPPVFRIASEEILWTEAGMRTRFHLAEGHESASRFTRYLDHDPLGVDYVAARLGPFTLDLSALDSEAHLDS